MSSMTRRLILASSLVLLALGTTPAWALCKYGGPNCVNPHPGPKLPQVNTTRLPDAPPGNEDCMYYGNCDDGSPEGTGPDGGPNGGLGTDHPALTGSGLAQFQMSGQFSNG